MSPRLLYRIARRWIYEATHEPADDGTTLRPLIRNVKALRECGARFVDGQLRDAAGRYLPLDIAWPYEETEVA